MIRNKKLHVLIQKQKKKKEGTNMYEERTDFFLIFLGKRYEFKIEYIKLIYHLPLLLFWILNINNDETILIQCE